MRFLIDMPLSPALAKWLLEQGHDAVHAAELGLERADDEVIIERARGEVRTVITADLDYPQLLALSEAIEPSLILFRGGDWSEQEVIDRMRQILATMNADEFEKCILVVERGRVRRRKLPMK